VLGECRQLSTTDMVARLIEDARHFSAGTLFSDDLTVMAIEMVGH
jgi:serine phosphatase RsbU (regulator of sigma subunit)